MYIWVAIDVDEQVLNLRKSAEEYAKSRGLTSSTLSLPFHISLKISFQIPDDMYSKVLCNIRDFFKLVKPFTIPVNKVEMNGSIIWLIMKDVVELNYIHNALDSFLLEKYGIEQHEFDKNFIFHTSILIIDDEVELNNALKIIKNIDIPCMLEAKKIIIGSSLNGKPGTYSVNEEIII